jgi:hypothetical protein
LSKEKVYEIITEAVEIEKEFISEALPVELIGMNSGVIIFIFMKIIKINFFLIIDDETIY